ncbi:hypothetical protein DE146DRAFT_751462 [Phaeosphaeria sp. MPI-PUGE-AT-0046c]|nr:hypothetical protein DE146DRAFT_751462 [Phaeosphaeria sp. MPI-PUGE-AT-0046c]
MSNTKYYRLSDSSDGEKGDLEPVVSENGGLSKRNTIFMGAILTGLMVITASLGFLAGRGFTKPSGYKIDRWNFEYVTDSFQYNRTFSEAPSPETDAAWMSLSMM